MKLELDSQERRAVAKSLLERRGRLIENAEDTTRSPAAKQSALLELAAIKSVLRKLRGAKCVATNVVSTRTEALKEPGLRS